MTARFGWPPPFVCDIIPLMSVEDYRRVETAIRYLGDNAQRQPSLDEVAEHVGLSKYHFQRLFVRWARVSPKRFVQYLTLEHAKALLVRAETVLETSHAVGLSGPSRLHDLFVTIEAVTPGEYRSHGAGLEIRYGVHASPFGACLVATTARGLCGLYFVERERADAAIARLRVGWEQAELRHAPRATAALVQRLFDRERGPDVDPIAVYLRGSPFQLMVWRALLRVRSGAVVSYQQLAGMVGRPRASRAVASAMARNPISYLIPCHRVIRATGHAGGYGGGPLRKRALLGWEAAQIEEYEDRSE